MPDTLHPPSRSVALLLNVAHALDHLFLLIFATAVAAIAADFGFSRWEDLMPYGVGAFLMFGLGSVPAGRLGDLWGRRRMMLVFFHGMGLSAMAVALTQSPWQMGLALTVLTMMLWLTVACAILSWIRVDSLMADALDAIEAALATALEGVATLDEDRILRRFHNAVLCTLRTNYWQANGTKEWISFKIDSRAIDELPAPRPLVEIFVYSPRMEGIHLRGGRVARAGSRAPSRA